ncbi:hypothetical protein BGZ47_001092 [Haplosporangium gracile]|nr:hypothetical protein BGZ47_001092 [Haplosporangium gracile]
MHSASREVFAIPELAVAISMFLNASSLLHLSMTSRLLYQTLTPSLWSSLDLLDQDNAELLLLSTDAHRALSRNFRHVRHLKVQTSTLVHFVDSMTRHHKEDNTTAGKTLNNEEELMSAAPSARGVPSLLPKSPLTNPLTATLPLTTRLDSLDYRAEQKPDGEYYFLDVYPNIPALPQLTWLINFNSSITRLNLNGCHIRSSAEAFLLTQAISTLTSLKELVLKFQREFQRNTDRWEDVVETLFSGLPTTLETLDLDADDITPERNRSRRRLQAWKRPLAGQDRGPSFVYRKAPLDRLKKLRIMFHRLEDPRLLCSFLGFCPALEVFDPPSQMYKKFRETLPPLAQVVVKHCPRLRGLDSYGQVATTIIEALPLNSLQSITNRGHSVDEAADEAFLSISRSHYGSLTEVWVDDGEHIQGSSVQALLWTCVNLEHFTIRGGCYAGTALKDLVEKEWVCTRLKTLEITVDLRQVSVLACAMSSMPAVHELTWIMLRKFYRQLGALTKVEILDLGIRSKEMQWLDEDGRERVAIGDMPKTRDYPVLRNNDDSGSWSADDDDEYEYAAQGYTFMLADNADASFPGLLSLGDQSIGRPGYLSWLGGLTKLRELRGWVQATTTETSKTLGRKELEWMSTHWPALKSNERE